ncbi:MAG: Gfo/Idh/MocA family oxidoreductase [Litorilinea sp.]
MTKSSPTVGYIGSGWTERVQIRAFQLGGLTAQAICSGNPENARRVAEKFAIPEIHEDWRSLIESPQVDIVSIVTPPHLHVEIAGAALAAGKHVICEKPTALNTQQAEAMLAAAQAAPHQLAIIDHELRFHPHRQKLRRLLRDNTLGTLLHLDIEAASAHRLDRHAPWTWHSDANVGGGILGAFGSHLLDLARWLVGRIDGLSATLTTGHLVRADRHTGNKRNVTSDDHVSLQIRFASGLRGAITASALDPGTGGNSVQIVGTGGAARIDKSDRLWVKIGENYHEQEWEEVTNHDTTPREHAAFAGNNPFAKGSIYLAQAIVTALDSANPQLTDAATFYDGLVVQRMLDAARASHTQQQWVSI